MHTQIEMQVMNQQVNFMNKVLEAQEAQVEAMEKIANQLEELMNFLHGTTIEQVVRKRQQLKKKTKKNDLSEVEAMAEFIKDKKEE